MKLHIRGSRDRRDWAEDINNVEPGDDDAPMCPGCWEFAAPGTYPPGTEGDWWCPDCLKFKVTQARKGVSK